MKNKEKRVYKNSNTEKDYNPEKNTSENYEKDFEGRPGKSREQIDELRRRVSDNKNFSDNDSRRTQSSNNKVLSLGEAKDDIAEENDGKTIRATKRRKENYKDNDKYSSDNKNEDFEKKSYRNEDGKNRNDKRGKNERRERMSRDDKNVRNSQEKFEKLPRDPRERKEYFVAKNKERDEKRSDDRRDRPNRDSREKRDYSSDRRGDRTENNSRYNKDRDDRNSNNRRERPNRDSREKRDYSSDRRGDRTEKNSRYNKDRDDRRERPDRDSREKRDYSSDRRGDRTDNKSRYNKEHNDKNYKDRRERPDRDSREKRDYSSDRRGDRTENNSRYSKERDDRNSNDRRDRPNRDSREKRDYSSDRRGDRTENNSRYNNEHDDKNYKDRRERPDRDSRSKKDYGKDSYLRSNDNSKRRTEYNNSIRLNKYIANAGICSRREADELILSGAVKVNGVIVTELGIKVSYNDIVQYGDQKLSGEKKRYVLLNKPKGYITTVDDPEGRNTVMMLIKNACRERIYPVGRLDRNTTGLLLFTNDGEIAKKLTHPKHRITKIYHVELDKSLKQADMIKITEGIEIEGNTIQVDALEYVDKGLDKKKIGIELHSGQNRVVRRIFESLDYNVTKLDRVLFAGLTKKDLPRGHWRFLTEEEVNILRRIR